jgi:hypothetical protein
VTLLEPFQIAVPKQTSLTCADGFQSADGPNPRFPSIVHWGEPERGGHFGAWEQLELFISEVRAVSGAHAVDG